MTKMIKSFKTANLLLMQKHSLKMVYLNLQAKILLKN